MPKSCLICKHLYLDEGSPHYSEMTPGHPMAFECLKGFWDSGNLYNAKSMREAFAKALTCEEFEQVQEGE